MQDPVRKLVIAGGGTAGWMSAVWFSTLLKDDFDEIVLVESDEIGIVGVGEATTPYIQVFNQCIGLDEDAFLKFTKGTFKLGIEFVDWGKLDHTYHHPFGPYGRDYGSLPFHAVWLRQALSGNAGALEEYNLQSLASRAGKFMRPQAGNSPLAGISYAFHFDASLYARYLRSLAEKNGVRRVEGKIAEVQLTETGFISGLRLDSGETVTGDLFFDCTGFRSLLLGQALGVGFVDWSHWLPCDRAWAVPTTRNGPPAPYTRSTARDAGWQWRIPLQHRDGNGHVFSSAFMDEDTARQRLYDKLEGEPQADARLIRFTTGRREVFWKKNCIAVGLAAGFLEPLESTAIALIQNAIARLQYLFPDKGFEPADIDTYNAEMTREYEDVRDFLILHYKAGVRDDSEFWRYCANMSIPDALARRIELFESRGRIPAERGEQFRMPSWLSVMWGQGLRPRAADPMTLSLPEGNVTQWLADLRQVIGACCQFMPSHAQFISQHCASDRFDGL